MKRRKLGKRQKTAIKRGIIAALVVIGGILLWHQFTKPKAPDLPLVTMAYRGGQCAKEACHKDYNVYKDGRFSYHAKLPAETIKKVEALVSRFDSGDYPKVDCGASILDGFDVGFIFPGKYNNRRFEACQMKGSGENVLQKLSDLLIATTV